MAKRTAALNTRRAPRNAWQRKWHTRFVADVPPSMWKYLRPYDHHGERGFPLAWWFNLVNWSARAWLRHREVAIPATVAVAALVLTHGAATALAFGLAAGLATGFDWIWTGGADQDRDDYRFRCQVEDAVVAVVCAQQRKENQQGINPLRNRPTWLSSSAHYWPVDRDGDGHRSFRERLDARLGPSRNPHSRTATVKLPLGIADSQMREIVHQLDRVLDADCSMNHLGQGRAQLRVVYEDVLDYPMPYPLPPRTPPATLGRICVGRNRWADHSHRALLNEDGGRSWLFAGINGAGKTSAINSVLAEIIPIRDKRLVLIDPAGGVDIGWAHPYADIVVTTAEDGIDLLVRIAEWLPRRTAAMKDRLEKVTAPNPDFPPVIIVIDELADLTAYPDRGRQTAANVALWKIMRAGRKAGVSVIAATQNVSVEVITNLIRGQFKETFGLRTRTKGEQTAVFGTNLDDLPGSAKVNLAAIPEDQHGRCWNMSGGSLEPLKLRGLFGAGLKARAKEIADEVGKYQPQPVLVVPSRDDAVDDSGSVVTEPARSGANVGAGPTSGALNPPTEAPSSLSPAVPPASAPEKRRQRDTVPLAIDALRSAGVAGLRYDEWTEISGIAENTLRHHVGKGHIHILGIGNYRYRLDESKHPEAKVRRIREVAA